MLFLATLAWVKIYSIMGNGHSTNIFHMVRDCGAREAVAPTTFLLEMELLNSKLGTPGL